MSVFNVFARPRRRKSANVSPAATNSRMTTESLEQRQLMTTLVVLDFDGTTAAEEKMALELHRPSGWSPVARSSFTGGFATLNSNHTWNPSPGVTRSGGYNEFRFLDFNSDGRLDQVDGEIAVGRIMDRVRRDFAPYDVQVIRDDNTSSALSRIRANSGKDTLVAVDGSTVNVGGQAAADSNNAFDSFANAGGSVGVAHWILDNFVSRGFAADQADDAFLNLMGNFISHEVGHTFGLAHLIEARTPSMDGRTLMDPFLWVNDVGFTDTSYSIATSTDSLGNSTDVMENPHQYLTSVIGLSKEAWAAVLTPGTLTLVGGDTREEFDVLSQGSDWDVVQFNSDGYITDIYRVDPAAQINVGDDLNSLNQFNTAITAISYRGNGGDDTLNVSEPITAMVFAWGGAGNDTLFGGGGHDWLAGDDGNDRLNGRSGSDLLLGGRDWDRLEGGPGNDMLSGGQDGDTYLFDADLPLGEDTIGEDSTDDAMDLLDFSNTTSRAVQINLGLTTQQTICSNLKIQLSRGDAVEHVYGSKYAAGPGDLLIGNARDNVFYGFQGDDILVGMGGKDQLFGMEGRDMLFGGSGADQLWGGTGEDILAGSRTSYADEATGIVNLTALTSIRNDWRRTDLSYTTRVDRIYLGTGSTTPYRLDATTVLQDKAVDELRGDGDLDYYFAHPGTWSPFGFVYRDSLFDATADERVRWL